MISFTLSKLLTLLIYPLSFCLLLSILAFLLRRLRWEHLSFATLLFALTWLYLCSTALFANFLVNFLERIVAGRLRDDRVVDHIRGFEPEPVEDALSPADLLHRGHGCVRAQIRCTPVELLLGVDDHLKAWRVRRRGVDSCTDWQWSHGGHVAEPDQFAGDLNKRASAKRCWNRHECRF